MAHVGRLYRLWFRRDAAWDLNNYKFAFPEAYLLFSHGFMTSARYDVADIDTVFAVNTKKTYDRTWTSEPVGGFFDNAYWQIQFSGPHEEQLETCRFSVWHKAIIDTPLFDATFFKGESSPAYFNARYAGLKQLHFLSGDVQVDPERFHLTIIAARWNVYNP
jgi:hypothetical protein